MSQQINVISRTQIVTVDKPSGNVVVSDAGQMGPAGPPGPPGEDGSGDPFWFYDEDLKNLYPIVDPLEEFYVITEDLVFASTIDLDAPAGFLFINVSAVDDGVFQGAIQFGSMDYDASPFADRANIFMYANENSDGTGYGRHSSINVDTGSGFESSPPSAETNMQAADNRGGQYSNLTLFANDYDDSASIEMNTQLSYTDTFTMFELYGNGSFSLNSFDNATEFSFMTNFDFYEMDLMASEFEGSYFGKVQIGQNGVAIIATNGVGSDVGMNFSSEGNFFLDADDGITNNQLFSSTSGIHLSTDHDSDSMLGDFDIGPGGFEIDTDNGTRTVQVYASGGALGMYADKPGGIYAEVFLAANYFKFGGPGLRVLTASADLANSELGLALDDTPGATKLLIKAKDSGGTVRTGSVALT